MHAQQGTITIPHGQGGEHQRAAEPSPWALGDYHRFATRLIWQLGRVLVESCRIAPGQRVLDVAAGTGNTAIRAAEAGAQVVACDITPENFDAGRREARRRGVELQWVEGDAQALPFADAAFDVVTSSFGAMFAPDHRAVADELVRVCRPGGTIGMLTFRPTGTSGAFFDLLGRYAPPPPDGALPPILWGDEEHVRRLFAGRLDPLELTRRQYAERADSPTAYRDFYRDTFGPVIAIRSQLTPDRAAALDRAFLELATRENRADPGGAAEYVYDYLLIVGRTRR